MAQARITVKDTQDRILRGHPWVFANQITAEEGEYAPGDVVQVLDAKRRPLGQGYINPASLIRVRMLTPHPEEREHRLHRSAHRAGLALPAAARPHGFLPCGLRRC